MEWLKKKWWILLLGLLVVPVLAFRAMRERLAVENGEKDPIALGMDGLQLLVGKSGVTVRYPQGKQLPADGLGVSLISLEAHKKNPERLEKLQLREQDFPVLVFFNATGFDATGAPVVVRRARDGVQLYPEKSEDRVLVRAVIPEEDGKWTVYFWDDQTRQVGKRVVSDEVWYRVFMNEPLVRTPTPEELDKMSDEQLRAMGIQRMTKQELKLRQEHKHGIRGRVLKVGGTQNPVQPYSLPVHVLRGEAQKRLTGAMGQPTLASVQADVVCSLHADKDGFYATALSPGTYILVVEIGGKLYGNAVQPGAFPTVTVPPDGWIDYEIRRGE